MEVGGGHCPIFVDFESRIRTSFGMDGKWTDDALQTLFWSKPEFTPPPRPKRKVKKPIERWAVLSSGNGSGYFDNEADAMRYANMLEHDGWYSVDAVVHITGEYEVEE